MEVSVRVRVRVSVRVEVRVSVRSRGHVHAPVAGSTRCPAKRAKMTSFWTSSRNTRSMAGRFSMTGSGGGATGGSGRASSIGATWG